MTPKRSHHLRFTVFQRVQHWLLTLSFTTLAVTGLPQRYVLSNWAEWVIQALGGLESVRIIHRWAAVILIVLCFAHVVEIAYKLYILRSKPTMLPGIKDALDALHSIRYNLGLSQDRPKLPRYSFAEKAEYWALIWGTVLMSITGFMLWNPITSARFLPGEFIPAAKVAHSAEAFLACVAILIWHVYWVHLKTFNMAMLTGKLSQAEMEHEHAAELEEIEAGIEAQYVSEVIRLRRERNFYPLVAVAACALGIGLYFFTTYEETAIPTVPPPENISAFSLATPTATAVPTATPSAMPSPTSAPAVAAGIKAAPQIKHVLTGRDKCLSCHTTGPLAVPASHAAYHLGTCLICHNTDQPGPAPKPVAHALEGKDNCVACHTGQMVPASHQSAGLTNEQCLTCHPAPSGAPAAAKTAPATTARPTEAAAPAATPSVTVTVVAPQASPTTAASVTATAMMSATSAVSAPAGTAEAKTAAKITHALEGRDKCLTCHAAGSGKLAVPTGHAPYKETTCLLCHTTTGPGPAPKPVAHPLEGRTDCMMCHKALAPESHKKVELTSQDCGVCHPGAGAAEPAAAAPATASAATATVVPTEAMTATPSLSPTSSLPVTATAVLSATNAAPVDAAQGKPATKIAHTTDGREKCLNCHTPGGALGSPASHVSYKETTCLLCHTTTGPGAAPKLVTHPLEGRTDCMMCHKALAPESHKKVELTSQDCGVCHPGAGVAPAGAAVATPASSPTQGTARARPRATPTQTED